MVAAASGSPKGEMAGAADVPADHCSHHAQPDAPREESPAPASCPFMPMTAGSCASAASLPADVTLGVSSPLEHVMLSPPYAAFCEMLLTNALFHPPKA